MSRTDSPGAWNPKENTAVTLNLSQKLELLPRLLGMMGSGEAGLGAQDSQRRTKRSPITSFVPSRLRPLCLVSLPQDNGFFCEWSVTGGSFHCNWSHFRMRVKIYMRTARWCSNSPPGASQQPPVTPCSEIRVLPRVSLFCHSNCENMME